MDTLSSVLLAFAAFVAGAFAGYYLLRSGILGHARIVELEQALAASESELAAYKQQVTDEFTDTAEKFRDLNRSYEELHRQLAKSANALCGEANAPMLLGSADAELLAQEPLDMATQTDAADAATSSSALVTEAASTEARVAADEANTPAQPVEDSTQKQRPD